MLASRQVTLKHTWAHQLFSCVITLSTADVSKTFKQINIHKPAGPDGLPGHVLRTCAWPTGKCLDWQFQSLPVWSVISTCFTQTTIVPVPKSSKVTCLNDYQPVALISVAIKMIWEAGHGSHQHHYPRNPRLTQNCISPQQIHRWRNIYCTFYCMT